MVALPSRYILIQTLLWFPHCVKFDIEASEMTWWGSFFFLFSSVRMKIDPCAFGCVFASDSIFFWDQFLLQVLDSAKLAVSKESAFVCPQWKSYLMSRNVHSLKDNTCKYSIILWKHSYKWFQFHISLRTATSQQKLSKGALPCSCVLFLAVQSSPLGHGHTDDASSPSAGMWELDVMLMILYYSRTLWALKKCRNFEEYGFIKKPALLVLSVSQLIFSLPPLCVLYAQSKWQTCPFSILSSCFKASGHLKAEGFWECWMKKKCSVTWPTLHP